MADDQAPDDIYSLAFTGEPLAEGLSIVGFPRLSLKISVNNHNDGVVIARLCDVAPDNHSTLITYGVLNLTHAEGHTRDKVKALEAGKPFDVDVDLHSTGYKLPQGHRLRVAISSSWWPYVWPSTKAINMDMRSAQLVIPVYTGSENRTELVSINVFSEPKQFIVN